MLVPVSICRNFFVEICVLYLKIIYGADILFKMSECLEN